MNVSKSHVAIIVDAASHYGRSVARGAMQYANLRRCWNVSADFRQTDSLMQAWPQCDGAIVAGVSPGMFELIRQNIPRIVSCSSGTETSDGAVVCADSAACGRLAAEHLVDCRLKHFAYCGSSSLIPSQERLDGFRRALAERGYECAVATPPTRSVGGTMGAAYYAEIVPWLRALPKPVGILAFDDWIAYDLAAVCQAEQLLVPNQVAIVGVNNDDLLCPAAWPPLSSVEIDFHQLGYFAARQLDRLLSGAQLSPAERLMQMLPLGVVRRQSTDILAVRDHHVAAAVRFIRKHACEPCSIADILQHVPVGRRWLERKFVEVLDRTLHEELQHVRMETAKRLLLDSDEKIERIAEQCGFSTARSFVRAFRSILGTTPAAYRRAHYAEVIAREI